MENKFTIFLSKLQSQWKIDLTELSQYVEVFTLEEQEQLPGYLGDIYFIGSGAIGKYERNTPKRYIITDQLIFTPLDRHRLNFIALQKTEVYFLDRKKIYHIAQSHPDFIVLYDLLREQNQVEISYREQLLSLDKSQRLDKFREHYAIIIPLIPRIELALYLDISREYLRQIF